MMNYVAHVLTEGGVVPLKRLFLDGPVSLGFWGGARQEDICASITGSPAHFWATQVDACIQIVDRNFIAFATLVYSAFYLFCVFRFINTLLFYWSFTRPVLQQLNMPATTRQTQKSLA